MNDLPPKYQKPLGIVVGALGTFLVIYALIRLNSFESQLLRAFGGTDRQAMTYLVIGIPLFLLGVWLFYSPSNPD